MKFMIFAAMLAFALSSLSPSAYAKKKSEPAPKEDTRGSGEEKDPREETYEGNDRNSGGSFDGGGYTGGGFDGGGYGGSEGGGMMSEIFYVKQDPTTGGNVTVEERGNVLVYTEVSHEDMNASETCTTITRTTVDKKTGKVLATDSTQYCNNWPL